MRKLPLQDQSVPVRGDIVTQQGAAMRELLLKGLATRRIQIATHLVRAEFDGGLEVCLRPI
jgi:hypothetical protein